MSNRQSYLLRKTNDLSYSRFIETQDTQPLPTLVPFKPSMIQLRLWCKMDVLEVVKASGVRYCKIYRMEHGLTCHRTDVLLVLQVFSRHIQHPYGIEDIRGLHIQENKL